MEEPRIHRENSQIRGKPFTHFLFKALLFASIVVVVPLFPSQAPDFIAESVLTKFWELIHLLFIGIAVSYGIFCRRSAESEIETVSKLDSLQDDMSMMFHNSSSRFDEGYTNPYGYGEKRVNQGTIGGEEWKLSPNSLSYEKGVNNSNVQAWNSQFFQGESMVIVARPNCQFGEAIEPRSVGDYKPLGLPVRSLKSRVRKRESLDLGSQNESGLGLLGFHRSFDESKNSEFSYSGPQNLEQQFDEAVASPSPVPWRSRSGRMEMRENLSDFSRHFMPFSADETQFELFGTVKTPSLRSNMSFSSRAGSVASSQDDDSSSPSVASEVMDLKMEDEIKETSLLKSSASSGSLSPPKPSKLDMRKTKSFRGSSASLSSDSPPKPMKPESRKVKSYRGSYSSSSGFPSPSKLTDDKASSSALLSRDYSFDSLYEQDLKESENRRDDLFNGKESSFLKGLPRGKSVRTVRSGRNSLKKNFPGNQFDENDDNDAKTEFLREDATRNEGIDTPERNIKGSDDPSHSTKLKLFEDREFSEDISAELEEEEEAEVKPRISPSSSIEDVDSESVQGTRTPDSNEVDKKAGEFIAKFREQIRLQKVASMNRARGLRFGSNYNR